MCFKFAGRTRFALISLSVRTSMRVLSIQETRLVLHDCSRAILQGGKLEGAYTIMRCLEYFLTFFLSSPDFIASILVLFFKEKENRLSTIKIRRLNWKIHQYIQLYQIIAGQAEFYHGNIYNSGPRQ